jgi:hypothetical protein
MNLEQECKTIVKADGAAILLSAPPMVWNQQFHWECVSLLPLLAFPHNHMRPLAAAPSDSGEIVRMPSAVFPH